MMFFCEKGLRTGASLKRTLESPTNIWIMLFGCVLQSSAVLHLSADVFSCPKSHKSEAKLYPGPHETSLEVRDFIIFPLLCICPLVDRHCRYSIAMSIKALPNLVMPPDRHVAFPMSLFHLSSVCPVGIIRPCGCRP